MISATVDLYISTSVRQKESADGATFGPIADKIWDKGSKKGIPGFEISREICWREDLKITEVSPGVYSGEFEALLPFFYVEMKPDERFPGSNTDALFCGKHMSPAVSVAILDAYKHLEKNFSESTKTISRMKLAAKTLKFTAIAYALCVVVGMLVLSQTMKTGGALRRQWSQVRILSGAP